MIPFCGYHMSDYFEHWLKVGSKLKNLPKTFGVNWIRKTADGKFMWPGYSNNMRVLEWIIGRVKGTAKEIETEIGTVPSYSDSNWEDLAMSEIQFKEVARVDGNEWTQELKLQDELIDRLKRRLPKSFF